MREVRSYRVVGMAQPKGGKPATYRITIPPHIASLIPPGTEFMPELVEDGVLLRRVETIPVEVPSWARGGSA